MKIFEIRWTGEAANEKSWVSAPTIIGAIQTYCSTTDFNLVDFDGDEEIVELPREKWAEYKVTDEDGKFEKTFEQWMEDNKNDSDIIAESAYANYDQEY